MIDYEDQRCVALFVREAFSFREARLQEMQHDGRMTQILDKLGDPQDHVQIDMEDHILIHHTWL